MHFFIYAAACSSFYLRRYCTLQTDVTIVYSVVCAPLYSLIANVKLVCEQNCGNKVVRVSFTFYCRC